MKYCKSLFLLSILLLNNAAFAQTVVTEFIEYEVEVGEFKKNDNFSEWMKGLFEAVKKNEIRAYDVEYNINNMNLDFKEIAPSKRDSLFLNIYEHTSQFSYDTSDPFMMYDSTFEVIQNISYKDVVKISFIEKWETNEKGTLIKTIEAFAPVVISQSYYKNDIPLFWVKPSDIPTNLSFELDVTYRVQIRDKNANNEYWFVENILPPYRLRFLQPFIDKIEKGELKDFVLDTLLPKRKIDTIYFNNPLDLFISFEVITSETDPFAILEVGICELTVPFVIAMDFKEKWVLSSIGFAKKITEFALVFEVILVTLPDQYFEDQYMYVIFWIKPE